METKSKRRGGRSILVILGGLLILCLTLSIISAFSNRALPQADASDKLSTLDKARLAEAVHLKAELGDQFWPGFGSAPISIIVWNSAYEFLFEYSGTPPSDWSVVANDSFNGQPYYRRAADNPQNFAVPIGSDWAASIATKSATDAFLIEQFRNMFPTPLKQIFPYRFLIQPSETQIGGVLHESFHVYQIQNTPERLKTAEDIHRFGDQYEAVSEKFSAEFKQESALLAKALDAKAKEEKMELARQFLEQRDARRQTYHLDQKLIDYERWLEWEEGTAKYIEVASLKTAFETAGYKPQLRDDPDFKAYQAFDQRWSQELIQLRYVTTAGEQQFYMSGMAQAFLLDDLLPNWKEQYWNDDVFLEDLLRQALNR